MSLPQIVSPEQWLAARKELLAREKELTRLRDALNADRRQLPMTAIRKDYRFEGPDGQVGLAQLFGGARQLIIQHFMFDPDWDAGCPTCSASADELSPGLLAHLRMRDTAFAMVSLAPVTKIMAFKARRGWTFPWYSSAGSDFNYDFHVTLDETVTPVIYNYQRKAEILDSPADDLLDAELPVEVPGISCFLRDGDRVFHTYSTYARGIEQVGGAHSFLDLTALGRQEYWEEPGAWASQPGRSRPKSRRKVKPAATLTAGQHADRSRDQAGRRRLLRMPGRWNRTSRPGGPRPDPGTRVPGRGQASP
jgi:predicted dithiol-disulfide oxidoreductase (DUF899 family)